jgi:hypothetical protein
MQIPVNLIFLLGVVICAGCQGISNPTVPPLSAPQHVPTTQGETMTSPTPDVSGMKSLIEMARKDLAQRLSVSVGEISLVEAKPVVWPDSSMGCPQPGMAYLQIPEDGVLIVLQFEGVSYEYHNGGSRGLFLCEKTFKDLAPTPKIDIFNLTPSKSNPPPTTPDNSIPPGEDT